MQLADNAGATDEHRALNYLVMRYPAIYHQTTEQFGRNIVDVIFSYTNHQTDVSERALRADDRHYQ